MNQIKFSHNWNNKLSNDIFTTIRRFTDEKFDYYKENLNKKFEVVLKNKVIGNNTIISICLN